MALKNKYTCRGPKTTEGDRVGCGHVMNDLVEAVPRDNEKHFIECPKCGNETMVIRTPAAEG
jgi:transposase|tara:strand:+ start:19776 stop:19961 length:186 start_codon:yes stop_codon:yes gene_type:complete